MAYYDLDRLLTNYLRQVQNTLSTRPFVLGGGADLGGGSGGPPGGFIGFLPQGRVAYDLSEDASNVYPASGYSLVTNLDHIRYRLNVLEASGVGGSGSGISGPISSTDNAVVRWDGTDAKKIQNSLITVTDAGGINIPSGQTYDINGSPHTHSVPKLDDLSAPDNNTDLNVSITAHGLMPILPNDSNKFINGVGNWVTMSGVGGGSITAAPENVYLAANGNDSNTGLTSGSPKLTLQAAIDLIPDLYDRDVTLNISSGYYLVASGISIKNKIPLYPNNRLLIRGYMNDTANLFVDEAAFSGTLTGTATNDYPLTTTRVTDSGKNFGSADALKWYYFHITGGAGYDSANDENNWYTIESNGTTTIDICGVWNFVTYGSATVPNNTTTYEVFNPYQCGFYADAGLSNNVPVITIVGCENVVLRYLWLMSGDGDLNPGTGSALGIYSSHPHIFDDPTMWQHNLRLAWLGILTTSPAVAVPAWWVNESNIRGICLNFSGYTSSTPGKTGMWVGHSRIALSQSRFDVWDDFGIYLTASVLTLQSTYFRLGKEDSYWRGCICADGGSNVQQVQFSKFVDGYTAFMVNAFSNVWTQEYNLMTSCNVAVISTANSYVEFSDSKTHIESNTYGAYASRGGLCYYSKATMSGNTNNTGTDTGGQVW